MHEQYINMERTRRSWAVVLAVGLLLELTGAILMLTGRPQIGVAVALTGILVWIIGRKVGGKRYTALCAETNVRYGLNMRDAVKLNAKALQTEIPTFPLLPDEFKPNKPLLVHPYKGRWQGWNAVVAEMTMVYQPQPKTHHFLSGTLLCAETACAVPGLMAVYGHPYGGVDLRKWTGMSPVDTGDRDYLMLARAGTEVSEYILDAFAAFSREKETTAIIWTEAERVFTFLPIQFYSGNWTLIKYMPESAVGADPLPALNELPRLLKKIA